MMPSSCSCLYINGVCEHVCVLQGSGRKDAVLLTLSAVVIVISSDQFSSEKVRLRGEVIRAT